MVGGSLFYTPNGIPREKHTRNRAHMAVLLLSLALEAFVCPTPPSVPHRAAPVVMSAKIIPVANVALGSTLLYRAASANGANALVLASTGLLATCNLALTDNARYASAKRAMAKVENVELPLAKLAKRWYNAVRVQVASAPLHLHTSARQHTLSLCTSARPHLCASAGVWSTSRPGVDGARQQSNRSAARRGGVHGGQCRLLPPRRRRNQA